MRKDRQFGFHTLAVHAANLFAPQRFGNIYSRIMNPTVAVFEERVAALENGIGALATASGQAAQHLTLFTLMQAGDQFVDGGRFPWDNGKFPGMTEPSKGYHDLRFFEYFGDFGWLLKCRAEMLRDYGPTMAPFTAWLMLKGRDRSYVGPRALTSGGFLNP